MCAEGGDIGRQVGQIHDRLYWEGLFRPEHFLGTYELQAEHRKETPDQVTWREQTEQGWRDKEYAAPRPLDNPKNPSRQAETKPPA